MPQRVKLYEENVRKRGMPLWGWVLLLVVALTVLVMFFAHREDQVPARPATAPAGAPASTLIVPPHSSQRGIDSARLLNSAHEATIHSSGFFVSFRTETQG